MSTRHFINLYVSIEQVETLLLETAKIAVADAATNNTEGLPINFPWGKTVYLPSYSTDANKSMSLKTRVLNYELETSLVFPVDDILSKAWPEQEFEFVGEMCVAVGRIGIWIYLGLKYAAVYYRAECNSVNELFLESPSIHNTFLSLLAKSKGLFALLDTERGYYELLEDMTKRVSIDEWDFQADKETIDWDLDIDAFVEAVQRHLQETA